MILTKVVDIIVPCKQPDAVKAFIKSYYPHLLSQPFELIELSHAPQEQTNIYFAEWCALYAVTFTGKFQYKVEFLNEQQNP